jgi:tetratricopeptide (TPR) repeat protein
MVWTNNGWALFRWGKYDGAIECFDKAIKIKQNCDLAWKDKGIVLLTQTNAIYEAIKINLENAQNWSNIGIYLCEKDMYEEAIKCFDKAIEINRDYVLRCIERPARYKKALNAIDNAIKLKIRDADNWNIKGNALISQGKYNESLLAYDRAIELDPKNALIWFNKGNAFAVLERYSDAFKCYNWANGLDPNFALAWYNKGNALHELGRHKEAQNAINKANELGFAGPPISK